MKHLFYSFCYCVSFILCVNPACAGVYTPYFATMGTANSVESYAYVVGQAISNVVNEKRDGHNVYVNAETTGGSTFNVIQITLKDHQLGIVDIDTLNQAHAGAIQYLNHNAKGRLASVLNVDSNQTTLVADVDIDEDVIYVIVRELFENFETFRSSHSSLSGLTKEAMIEGLVPPVHPGVLKYLNEIGRPDDINDNGSDEPDYIISDTGIERCFADQYNHGDVCPDVGYGYYGQDGNYQGDLSNFQNNGDGTVTDTNTHLMWQRQAADTNGDGNAGDPSLDRLNWESAKNFCENLSFAGYEDWRLPTVSEFYSLIDFNSRESLQSFYTLFDYHTVGQHWTVNTRSSESACEVDNYYRDFSCGTIRSVSRQTRCVRGSGLRGDRFVDNGDGTVTDQQTGLVWQKVAADFDEDNELTNGDTTTWKNALKYCEELYLGSSSGWRLPNIRELTSLLDTNIAEKPWYNEVFLPRYIPAYGSYLSTYWSSSPKVNVNGSVYELNFYNGFSQATAIRYNPQAMVRCLKIARARTDNDEKHFPWSIFLLLTTEDEQ